MDWDYKGKRKFNMVTEVWAEPQFGHLTGLNSELKYLEGLQYNQVPNAVSVLYGRLCLHTLRVSRIL